MPFTSFQVKKIKIASDGTSYDYEQDYKNYKRKTALVFGLGVESIMSIGRTNDIRIFLEYAGILSNEKKKEILSHLGYTIYW